jgi:cytoskeletal protein CcmA (bactofilin family)
MAWKRDDAPSPEPAPTVRPTPPPPLEQRPPNRGLATIGPSIFVKGDLQGEEDLVIEGKVEGKVDLKKNHLTIGAAGRVRADIFGKVVIIEGEVDGNVFAQEQAILRKSGAVRGNITSPRVILEDGSRFRGSIDMEPKAEAKEAPVRPQNAPARSETSADAKHTPPPAAANRPVA